VLNISDAEHAETAPDAPRLIVSKLVCSLVGTEETVHILPGTLTGRAYGEAQVREQFACNFGLNPLYREQIFKRDFKAAGFGPQGEVRLLELASHPFFIGTLFLPQVSSTPQVPHPLILAFVEAASKNLG
jgi:CTP synthase (UTP-ammonia lyase)